MFLLNAKERTFDKELLKLKKYITENLVKCVILGSNAWILLCASHSAWKVVKRLEWPVVTFLFRYFPTLFNEGSLYHCDLSIRSLYNLSTIIPTARFLTTSSSFFPFTVKYIFSEISEIFRVSHDYYRDLRDLNLMEGFYFIPSLFNSRGNKR